ncbi:MAG: hypothetical protein GY716_07840 [bacterium]|nr:hypothetical protein [bacterium]
MNRERLQPGNKEEVMRVRRLFSLLLTPAVLGIACSGANTEPNPKSESATKQIDDYKWEMNVGDPPIDVIVEPDPENAYHVDYDCGGKCKAGPAVYQGELSSYLKGALLRDDEKGVFEVTFFDGGPYPLERARIEFDNGVIMEGLRVLLPARGKSEEFVNWMIRNADKQWELPEATAGTGTKLRPDIFNQNLRKMTVWYWDSGTLETAELVPKASPAPDDIQNIKVAVFY